MKKQALKWLSTHADNALAVEVTGEASAGEETRAAHWSGSTPWTRSPLVLGITKAEASEFPRAHVGPTPVPVHGPSATDKRCSWSLAASQLPRAPLGKARLRSPSSQLVGNRASGQHVDLGSVTTTSPAAPYPGGSGIGLGWLRRPNPLGSSGGAERTLLSVARSRAWGHGACIGRACTGGTRKISQGSRKFCHNLLCEEQLKAAFFLQNPHFPHAAGREMLGSHLARPRPLVAPPRGALGGASSLRSLVSAEDNGISLVAQLRLLEIDP